MKQIKREILLVGVPASGKTTYLETNQLIKKHILTKDEYNFSWFCSTDSIIDNIAFQYDRTYNEAFSCIKFAEIVFQDRIKEAIKHDSSLIIDRTNLTKSSRQRILTQIPDDYQKIAVVFFKLSYLKGYKVGGTKIALGFLIQLEEQKLATIR